MAIQKLEKFLNGVGSVVDICPSSDYTDYIPKQTSEERLGEAFEKVGQQIQEATDTYAQEQKT